MQRQSPIVGCNAPLRLTKETIMRISKDTINTLKVLSAINTNILIKKGNTLSTISPQKNVMASVVVAEEFPVDFAIYDLSEWLGVLSLFSDAEVEFTEKVATIKEGKSSIRYYAADASLLVVPTKEVKFPTSDVDFTLEAASLQMALRTAGVIRSGDITFEGDGTDIYLVVADLKNPNANNFKVAVGESDQVFKANLKVDNLKMAPDSYAISISSKKISRWKSTTQVNSVYYVACESTSEFS
jgi:hypothetical protein